MQMTLKLLNKYQDELRSIFLELVKNKCDFYSNAKKYKQTTSNLFISEIISGAMIHHLM